MADEKFVARMMAILVASYPNARIRRETIDIYTRDLADLPNEILDLACTECRTTLKFFPTIAEMREAAARIQTGVDRLPPAGEGWHMFILLSSRYANDGPGPEMDEIDNPVLWQTLQAMGWRYLCSSTNGVADRARFIELYNEYAKRGLRDSIATPALKEGRHEAAKLIEAGT